MEKELSEQKKADNDDINIDEVIKEMISKI